MTGAPILAVNEHFPSSNDQPQCGFTGLNTTAPFVILSSNGHILESSLGFQTTIGLGETQLRGMNFLRFFTFSNFVSAQEWFQKSRTRDMGVQEAWLQPMDGPAKRVDVHAHRSETPDTGDRFWFVFCAECVSDGTRNQNLIENAYQDTLTGLYNRRYLEFQGRELIASRQNSSSQFGLLVIDVDDFKTINDNMGHAVGDEALLHISSAMQAVLPLGEILSRYGGDEFIALISHLEDEKELEQIAADLSRAVRHPLIVDDKLVQLNVSIGASLYPLHGHTLDELIRKADMAMLDNKKTKAQRLGAAGLVTSNRQPDLSDDISTAITYDQLIPYLQPIVDTQTQQLRAAEALCRWRLGNGQIRMPAEFIPIAETQGAISRIDKTVFRKSCDFMADHADQLPETFQMFVNLSAVTLRDPGLQDQLSKMIYERGLKSAQFCIELTESALLSQDDPGRDSLYELSEKGFSIALDDFGTGFSALSLLKELPISKLKIDRSFVANIHRSKRDCDILKSILSLCASFGAQPIVEGIETAAQLETAKGFGAGLAQGYLFGRPCEIQAFGRQIAEGA